VLEALGGPLDPVVAPVAVMWDGKGTLIPNRSTEPLDCTLHTEEGDERSWRQEPGTDFEIGPLPLGYHDLDTGRGTTRIISAPLRAPLRFERAWGVFMPLYALRTERDWGTGDLTDLEALIGWTKGMGGEFVATLPLFAAFLDEPLDPSPYAPVSRLFWNELYIDPLRTPEFRPEWIPELEELRRAELVDFRRAYSLKRRVLEQMAATMSDRRRSKLERFTHERPHLMEYARFRGHELFHLYAQFVADEQLRSLDGLNLDLPVGVHPSGFDVERFGVFASAVSAGAPPDGLFAGGQNWGFPPLHPLKSRTDGHRYFSDCIRTIASRSSVIRIDHVMGLHRLYWVPDGHEATDGAYVRYPADELYAVLTLEAHRHGTTIVGEDLGTVPRSVRRAMRKHGLLRSYVLQFEGDRAPRRDDAAYLSTHDTPTFAAYSKDLRGAVADLAAGDASLLVVALEDLWGEEQPQNVPGATQDEYPSFRRRAAKTLEEFRDDAAIKDVLAMVDELRARRKEVVPA
jgi:4-alpha-glucanotransferase